MLKEAFKIGIKPNEFWEMSFKEFRLCVQAYYEKQGNDIDLQRQILAWHAASIINGIPFRKKAVTPKQLLGKKSTELSEQFSSFEEFKASLKRGAN